MGKFNKHQSDSERFGKCEICLNYIPIEYYYGEGEPIVCYECGSEYILTSKNPVRLVQGKGVYRPGDTYEDFYCDK